MLTDARKLLQRALATLMWIYCVAGSMPASQVMVSRNLLLVTQTSMGFQCEKGSSYSFVIPCGLLRHTNLKNTHSYAATISLKTIS